MRARVHRGWGVSRPGFAGGIIPAFTLIEMMVVLGIVTVIIGLTLPALGASRERAARVALGVRVRENAVAIQAYVHDHKGMYPVADRFAVPSSTRWYRALTPQGYVPNSRSVDPHGFRAFGENRIRLSLCMLMPWEKMVPGNVERGDAPLSTQTYDHWVTYPSGKGLLIPQCSGPLPPQDPRGRCFCCVDPVVEPVAFADTSTALVTRLDLIGGDPPVIIGLIGYPVWSTWGGYRGRDR